MGNSEEGKERYRGSEWSISCLWLVLLSLRQIYIPEPFNHTLTGNHFSFNHFFSCKWILSSLWREFTIDEVYFCHILYVSVLLKLMTGIKPSGPLKKSDSIYLIVRGFCGREWAGAVRKGVKENNQEWRMAEVTTTTTWQKKREEGVPTN